MTRIGAWFARHPLRPAVAALLAIVLLGGSGWAWRTPRGDRVWDAYLTQTERVEVTAANFSVDPVTDWTYSSEGPRTRQYRRESFDLAALKNVWFVLEPQPGMDYAAHTFLMFEFDGDRLLGVTIEARRQKDQEYDAVRGLFNQYELDYVWGEARDLMTRRAVMLNHQTFVFPLTLSDAAKRMLLTRMLERTQDLTAHPRFYNTLFSNCTNEIAKATEISWRPSFILTGGSAADLYELHLIPAPSFAVARTRADVSTFVRAWNSSPSGRFDAALLAELRRRNAAPAS